MRQELDKGQILSIYRNVMEFLSESSNDYFYLLDIATGELYFPREVGEDFGLLREGADCCTLEDWYGITYFSDLPGLREWVQHLSNGEETSSELEYRIVNRWGEIVWIKCRSRVQLDRDGARRWMIGRISDAAAQNKTDQLTGAFHMDMLKQEITTLLSENVDGYLLLMDVDGQKQINLQNGQEFGDRVLQQVVESLEAATGGEQRIYRIDGDCFAVNLPGLDARAVTELFEQIQLRLRGCCTISGGCVPFQTYRVPDAGMMLQYAENSLDYAKLNGKNTLRFFSADDYERVLSALELQEELRKSVRDHFRGFSLHYQPQVLIRSYQLHGAEALLRYQSPSRGSVSPQEFIPILEESGMICDVGMWVLETALAQCRKWRERRPGFCNSLHMFYAQLGEDGIVERVLTALRRSGLPGSALTVEVTESAELLDYTHLNDTFRRWKEWGIKISIDDFGTGYSSLGRLKEMEVDEIKIDRSFVSNIQNSAYNFRLLSNMMALAESSHIGVCCEGVETTEELAVLEELGPGLLQGFLFSRPCTTRQFEERYIDSASAAFRRREREEEEYRRAVRGYEAAPAAEWKEEEVVQAIMAAENDIFYVSDLETYELYYLNPAGKRMLGLRDYHGKKCYKALQGRDEPCPFCTNKYLRSDDFYIWDQMNEYCGRHFVLKDKLIHYKGKQARMEVALDVTKHEIVSQNVQERLNFANKVVEYTQILSEYADYGSAVNHVLASVGEFYQADRAYLFEPDGGKGETWSNTYEWCRSNVSVQIQNLQAVPRGVMERWMSIFQQNRSVILFNLDTLQKSSPEEWRMLKEQDISRMIAVPVRLDDELIAFIGIDNPRNCIHDDSQARVLAYFLVNRVRQERNEKRLREMLSADYNNALFSLGVGLWILRIDPGTNRNELLADDTMCRVMGAPASLTPEECYLHWYNRINQGYYHYVNQVLDNMIQSRRVAQMEYTWRHPEYGEVIVQATGVRVEDEDGMICLKGYHRIISDTDCTRPVPDDHVRDVFEYNELNRTIFFHSQRSLILGEENHESDFPQCWIHTEIVHPHFAAELQKAFCKVCLKADLVLPEILLKGKGGTYEWFKLTLRHLGREQQDLNTIVVVVEPTGAERVKELESIRRYRFYQALLSETVAYAEVDLESGQLKSLGGVWLEYEQDYSRNSNHFAAVLEQRLLGYLSPEEVLAFRRCCSRDGWEEMFQKGESRQCFCYQRPIGGEMHWVEMVIHIFREDITQNVYALLYLKDIHAEKERAIAQDRAANRDPLTGVYNRTAFERLVCEYVRSAEQQVCGVLILLDVDNFKMINDNEGHLTGDQALREVSQILRTTFRQNDIVGRLGGDEFLVFVKGWVDRESLSERLQLLQSRMDHVMEFPLGSSIGVTFVNTDSFNYNRYGKQKGKHQFFFFDSLAESR